MLNAKETILKKIDASFIVHVCLNKDNFGIDTFIKYLV